MASLDGEPAAMTGLDRAFSALQHTDSDHGRSALLMGDDTGDEGVARAYLASLRRLTQVHRRRRAGFKAREGGKATDRMFILSGDQPWTVFARETRVQRRRWALETCETLQWPALHDASRVGALDAVKKTLSTRHKRSLAHHAASIPTVDVGMRVHLQCSLLRDACGRIALHHAVICERWAVVKWLLKRPDAPLQLRAADYSHRTPVHYVLEKMEHIVQHHPCRLSGASVSLVTMQMREICPRYRRLWRNVDRMLGRMNTLVIPAPDRGHQGAETVEELDFRCRGDLWDSCRTGDVKRLEFLVQVYYNTALKRRPLEADVVLSELRWSLLHEACSRSHAAVVHFLLTHERLRCFRDSALLLLQDTSGCTALHYAAKHQSLEVSALLTDECADLGEPDSDDFVSMGDAFALSQDTCGRTALHWCLMESATMSPSFDVACGSRSVVAKFLAQKCPASLHVRDHDGITPLHLAVCRGDAELVQCFLDLGADADASIPLQLKCVDGIERCAKTKASWAPCGLLFQQRKHAKPRVEHNAENNEEAHALSFSHSSSTAQVQDRQSTNHLFECPSATGGDDDASAMYYWIRRMTARRCATIAADTKMTLRTTAGNPHYRQATDSDETDQATNVLVGCLKYGGSCSQCRPAERDQRHLDASTDELRVGVALSLPPLILALRVCSRVTGAKLSDRTTIVGMLLASGAQPDGIVEANGGSSGNTAAPFCALLEAMRTGQLSLVYVLLSYGATSLNSEHLEHYCSTDWSAEILESLLSPLISLQGEIESEIFITTLFIRKCFGLLSQVIDASLWAEQNDKCSVWRVILHHLEVSVSRRRQRKYDRDGFVDRDHLEFLCRVADVLRLSAPANEEHNNSRYNDMAVQEEATSSADTDGLTELIEFCVGICLKIWAHPNASCPRLSTNDFEVAEATVMRCIRHLSSARDSFLEENDYLEQLIACKFFQAVTIVLEARLASSDSHISLDRIFSAFEKGTRRLAHLDTDDSGRHADDFLCVWLSKLLLQDCDPSSSVGCRVTMLSAVYTCAHNLPFRLIERCLELATAGCSSADHQGFERYMEAIKTIRVGGKRIEQWLIVHRRLDVIHSVFRIVCQTPQSAWSFWRDLMAAAVASCAKPNPNLHGEDAESSKVKARKWLSELLTLPSTLEAMSPSSAEFELETLEWIIVHRVVPNDCEQMMKMLLPRIRELNQQHVASKQDGDVQEDVESKSTDLGDMEGADDLRHRWTRMRLIYVCARWNATSILTIALEAIRAEAQDEDIKVWVSSITRHADTVDGCSAVEIARLMGHLPMRRALATSSSSPSSSCGSESPFEPSRAVYSDADGTADDDSEGVTQGSESRCTFGSLRAILAAHEHVTSSTSTNTSACTSIASVASIAGSTRQYFAAPSISEDLETACRSTHVHHLAILTDLLSASTVVTALDSQLLGRLALTAVTSGALDALKWVLGTYSSSNLTEGDSNACMQLVARRMSGHGGDVFVEMCLLLLDHSFPPGRLAGDGGEITVLHRAACVGNTLLARRIITRILAIDGCDINVLDSHGNTPVVYALASGHLENACFLMQHTNCRLEAEYEGQACFYYTLNLVPSLSARRVVTALLMTKRAHAFLHCDADSGACACKSFEMPAAVDDESGDAMCNFCGHAKSFHHVLPLPSWFRDQYDTYVDRRLACRAKAEQNDEGNDNGYCRDDVYGDEDDSEGDQEQQSQPGTSEVISDEELENTRGRLDADALALLALIRYEPIISKFGLQDSFVPPESSPSLSADIVDADSMTDSEMKSVWSMVDLHVLDVDSGDSRAESSVHHNDADDVLDQWVQMTGVDLTDRQLSLQLPWFIRADVGMMHPANCVCQCAEFVTTPQMLLHVAVCRWLRLTVAKMRRHNWYTAPAFTSWRYATASPSTEHIDHESQPSQPNAVGGSTPIDQSTDRRRETMLKRAVVVHWRLGRRALTAFCTWKQRSTSPELVHHALEDTALSISADMRRNRLETLRLRQLQVQQAARAIASSS